MSQSPGSSTSESPALRLSGHSLPLDGLRGIAVLMVFCYDCLRLAPSSDPLTLCVRRFAASGWIGVDLFFVLSGFLITGVLLETRGRTGYWKSFFLRRSVRIFPLYYATLFGVFCLAPLGMWLLNAPSSVTGPYADVQRNQLWYWLYLENWLFAWQHAWPTGVPVKHFWSLAIEEQFYLGWPLAVALLSRRQLGWLCVGLTLVSVTLRVGLLAAGVPPMVGFVMTITRFDGLCCGALLAIALRSKKWQPFFVKWSPRLALLAVMSVLGLDLVWPVLRSETYAAYSLGHLLTGVTFLFCVAAAQSVPAGHPLAKGLSIRPLLHLGKYSYAIYVFHKFAYEAVIRLDWSVLPESIRGWAIFATALLVSLVAARISWLILESPCLSLKRYFPRPDEPSQQHAVPISELPLEHRNTTRVLA